MELKIKHLEFIQQVITRMANNSFSLKGWAVTLIAGIFVLSDKDADKAYFLITLIPIVVFWGLDSYYLYQERLFRSLYDLVRLKSDDVDFSMNTSLTEVAKDGTVMYFKCVFSKTIICFYLPLLLLSACAYYIPKISFIWL